MIVSVVDPDAHTEFEAAPLQRTARAMGEIGAGINWDTLHGDDAADAILGFVATRPSPVIAMTTHGRTGLSRIAAGSVTMSVVHRAPCPVLVSRSRSDAMSASRPLLKTGPKASKRAERKASLRIRPFGAGSEVSRDAGFRY